MDSQFKGFNSNFYLLEQLSDPLEYCSINIPVPLPFGIPVMPCDLPNQFALWQTDSQFSRKKNRTLIFEEVISTFGRLICCPSHRKWRMVGRDDLQNCPVLAERKFNIPLLGSQPQIQVFYKQEFAGRIIEKTRVNFYCNSTVFQQFDVVDPKGKIIFRISSPSRQRGQCLILPFCQFDHIDWIITRPWSDGLQSDDQQRGLRQSVGLIRHLYSGLGQYTNKTDLYGIKLPEESSDGERALLLMGAVFIDYLLFQNF